MGRVFTVLMLMIVAFAGWVYYRYETFDPCMILAHEQAYDTIGAASEFIAGDSETLGPLDDLILSVYQTIREHNTDAECAEMLIEEWRDNIEGLLP